MRREILSVLVCLFFLSGHSVFGQMVWDLKQCIDHALENNLQVKKSDLNVDLSSNSVLQSKGNALPSVNGFASNSYNYGQTIDPYTNTFAQDMVRSNNFAFSTSFTLFNGFQNINSIKQSHLDYLSSKYDADKLRNDISLAVANAYLQVLFSEELLGIAQNQANIIRQQTARTKKLVDAGSLPKGSQLEIEAQLATEELQVVNAENQLDMAYLNLRQLLELNNTTEEFSIVKPELEFSDQYTVSSTPGQVFDAALMTLPDIKSAEFKRLSADKGLSTAKGTRSPRIVLNGAIGTGYSGAYREVTNVTPSGIDTVGYTNTGQMVLVPSFDYQFATKPFMEQLGDNRNQSFGFSITFPFLNGLSSRTAITRARIMREMAEYDYEITKNRVQKDIQQAYTDAVAALKRHNATQKSVESLKEAFKYVEQRFNVGLVNAVEYNDAKNRLAQAESELLQAKYDYVFKSKILDFYQGKSLAF